MVEPKAPQSAIAKVGSIGKQTAASADENAVVGDVCSAVVGAVLASHRPGEVRYSGDIHRHIRGVHPLQLHRTDILTARASESLASMALGATSQSLARVPQVLQVAVDATLRLDTLVRVFRVCKREVHVLYFPAARSR